MSNMGREKAIFLRLKNTIHTQKSLTLKCVAQDFILTHVIFFSTSELYPLAYREILYKFSLTPLNHSIILKNNNFKFPYPNFIIIIIIIELE